ncbi:Cell division protein FtsI/penicillin-binding protein 2 [Candidatus Hepatincolaceae symbiont of Richtersius coronifer]
MSKKIDFSKLPKAKDANKDNSDIAPSKVPLIKLLLDQLQDQPSELIIDPLIGPPVANKQQLIKDQLINDLIKQNSSLTSKCPLNPADQNTLENIINKAEGSEEQGGQGENEGTEVDKIKVQKLQLMNRYKYVLSSLSCLLLICVAKMSYIYLQSFNKVLPNYNSGKAEYLKRDIVDREGNVIALNIPGVSVYLKPQVIKNKELAVEALVASLNLDEAFAKKAVYSKSPFVWAKRNINKEEEIKLKYYGILGIEFQKEQKRFYPYGRLFSHVVGVTDVDGNGISGIENSFNDKLMRQNVELSLDLRIQLILAEALKKAKDNNQAKAAYGMVIDTDTSEVLAMVSLPDFNPNLRSNIQMQDMFNYPTQGVFESGSVAKVFTMAIALNEGKHKITDKYDVSTPIVRDSFLIVDFDYMDRSLSLPEILMYSSNIGTSLIMQEVGVDTQVKYFENLNLFKATSLEVKEKEKSLVPKKWTTLGSITLSYGYGVAVSQSTFINAFGALVNGGIYRPLTFLKIKEGRKIEEKRVITQETSRILRGMLRLTVATAFGKRANVEGYTVAGKSGSSEKQVNGKYQKNKVIASFVATFPVYQPKYAIIISIDEPKRLLHNNYNITGGSLSAPVIAEVIEKMGHSLGVAKKPDFVELISRNDVDAIIEYVENMPDLAP